MKKIILSVIITITSLTGISQVADSTVLKIPKTIHKLGLHAGTTSGLGLSYKALLNNSFMIQVVTLPIASKDLKYINSGLSLKYKFKDLAEWDFYAYGAGNYIFNESTSENYNFFTDEYSSSTTTLNNTHFSSGIAIEYGEGELVKWSLQIGYAAYNVGSRDWLTNLSIGTTLDFSLNSK